ncbi:MAG: protein-tyrosine-phosphatase [Sphingomonadaceae bacterium]|nr:protein-tyrosine-phosphatase [Sphingomonadaceae bacterium]
MAEPVSPTTAEPAVPPEVEPVSPTAPDPAPRRSTPSRIVAIGDLHGDHAAFRAIVEAAGLVDAAGVWIGGDAVLVQTGDVPDRGPNSLLILRDLMRLQGEAAVAGGQVVALIGNHEAMNVVGDLRYVHEGEFAVFRTDESQRLRRRYYRENQEMIERVYRWREPALSEDQIRRLWLRETPLGGAELLMAWGPDGEIGQWLADNPAVARIDDTLFAHGGISETYSALSIAEMNARTATAIAARDGSPEAIINDPDGPLWYRGYFLRGEPGELALVPPADAAPEVDRVLAAYGARRIVVGHTPSLGGIRILLGGRLMAIDTGISAHYGGVRSYLEINGDAAIAHIVGEGENP